MEPSVFIMVTFIDGPCLGSLFEVKVNLDGKTPDEIMPESDAAHLLKPVARFAAEKLRMPVVWDFCTLGNDQLCLLPDIDPNNYWEKQTREWHKWWRAWSGDPETPSYVDKVFGHMFDVKTRKLLVSSIKPPNATKCIGRVISAYENIYFLVEPYSAGSAEEPSFEKYDPNNKSWTSLCRFPYSKGWDKRKIVGYAVCHPQLLVFNVSGSRIEDKQMWAYDIVKDKWHPVNVIDTECYNFQGKTVVADDGVWYALSNSWFPQVLVMGFSVRHHSEKECYVTCSLHSLLQSPELVLFPPYADFRSQSLTLIGGCKFCLVQSGFCDIGRQYSQTIRVSVFQVVDKSVIVHYTTVYKVDLEDRKPFNINFCFVSFLPSHREEAGGDVLFRLPLLPAEEEENSIQMDFCSCFMLECEECEIATPANQPQEENMDNVSYCLSQECEEMKTEECGIAMRGGGKRKLDEI